MNGISVIIPTTGRLAELKECLTALAEQSSRPLIQEIIVIEDHCEDGFLQKAKDTFLPLSLPLKFLSNDGRGAASARNLGASVATGEILGFLDDDSAPAKDWVCTIVDSLESSNAAAITGRILPKDTSNMFSSGRQLRYEIRQDEAIRKRQPVQFFLCGNSAVWKRDFFSAGGFTPCFLMMEGREFVLKLFKNERHCFYVNELVVKHNHFKGVRALIREGVRSGLFRLHLEHHHPNNKQRWKLGSQLYSFYRIFIHGRQQQVHFRAILAACVMEALHTAAYVCLKILSALRKKPTTPCANLGTANRNSFTN